MSRLRIVAVTLVCLGATPAPTPDSLRAQVKTLLASWAAAQHAGDAAAYLALYDPKRFRGQKRVTSGEKKQYDFAAWAADRTRMLKNRPEVAVEEVRIETWLDAKSPLKPNVIHVQFLQRWRSPRYADHGPKIMQLYVAPDGKMSIIYEALLQSRPGWERAAGVAREVRVPRDEADARALWAELKPTGKTWEGVVASLPDVPQLRRLLAKALLAGGNLHCEALENEGSCGEDDYRWRPIPEDAGLDNPCLRRELAVWALEKGKLSARDLEAVWPELEKVFAYETPYKSESTHNALSKDDDPLCSAVLTASAVSDALHGAAVEAAIAGECSATAARSEVAGLPLKQRVKLAAAAVPEAFDGLEAKAHKAVFLDVAKRPKVSSELRVSLIQELATVGGADVMAALRALADDPKEDDEVAANAGAALATLGDKSRVPRRPDTYDAAAIERAFRRVHADPDGKRSEANLRAFLPKRGVITIRSTTSYAYDGNTAPEDQRQDEETTTKVPVKDVSWSTFEDYFKPGDGQKVTLVWDSIGGKHVVVGVEIAEEKFIGCPC